MVVPDIAKLKADCGRNHYQQALLLMLHATTMPALTPAEKQKLMEVRFTTHYMKQNMYAATISWSQCQRFLIETLQPNYNYFN